ncbi:hypothetical protein BDV25DRAFT_136052 [Aspergillus avenaceus]|uniref:Ricin B lectin domain-containing protein n=1 Tax=Aspergillus avenaceus TaxID=36643 RepID=A0A5N6U6X2_ASPAV|nr:hypothetical protein BDV25DRAFT_136052 [Aspergillus avenaceus]
MPLDDGLYAIKLAESDYYLSLSDEGELIAQKGDTQGFTLQSEGDAFTILSPSGPLGAKDHVVAAAEQPILWTITKAEIPDGWVIGEQGNSSGWWLNPEESDKVAFRTLIAFPTEPPRYPPPEIFVFEKR